LCSGSGWKPVMQVGSPFLVFTENLRSTQLPSNHRRDTLAKVRVGTQPRNCVAGDTIILAGRPYHGNDTTMIVGALAGTESAPRGRFFACRWRTSVRCSCIASKWGRLLLQWDLRLTWTVFCWIPERTWTMERRIGCCDWQKKLASNSIFWDCSQKDGKEGSKQIVARFLQKYCCSNSPSSPTRH